MVNQNKCTCTGNKCIVKKSNGKVISVKTSINTCMRNIVGCEFFIDNIEEFKANQEYLKGTKRGINKFYYRY